MYIGSNLNDIYNEALSTYKFNSMCTKIVRTSLFKNDNTNYSKNIINHGEDIAISLFLIFNAKSILTVEDYLYFYRQNNLSTTHRQINLCDIDKYNIIEMVELKLDYIRKYKLNNDLINYVLLSCVKNLKEIFIRSGLTAKTKSDLNLIISYNWEEFLPNGYSFDNIKNKVHNLKKTDKLVINAIKSKNIFYTKLILNFYKIFYKIKKFQ